MDINNLPSEVLCIIFGHLRCCHLYKCSAVCTRWRDTALDPHLFHGGRLCITMHENPTVGAALCGHIECLALYQRHAPQRPRLEWTTDTVAAAAYGGRLACLQYLVTQRRGTEDCHIVATAAASKGHLRCLKYAVKNVWGKPDQGALCAAIAGAHTECVLYLITQGEVWVESIVDIIARLGNVDMLRRIDDVCGGTARWAAAGAYAFNACALAARRGDVHMLRLLHHMRVRCRESVVCAAAAESGSVECLAYIRESACACRMWDEATCKAAARHGHLECLRYAHENGCPWNRHILYEAAVGGHAHCVKYALDNGCGPVPVHSLSSIVALAGIGLKF